MPTQTNESYRILPFHDRRILRDLLASPALAGNPRRYLLLALADVTNPLAICGNLWRSVYSTPDTCEDRTWIEVVAKRASDRYLRPWSNRVETVVGMPTQVA